jgi:hypothetical protein
MNTNQPTGPARAGRAAASAAQQRPQLGALSVGQGRGRLHQLARRDASLFAEQFSRVDAGEDRRDLGLLGQVDGQ